MTPSRLLALWHRFGGSSLGRWWFTQLLRFAVPYSGNLGAHVISVEPGRATVTLRDRRAVRNHLRSIHAIALANLAELSSGLAMLSALDASVSGIPVALTIRYHAKARGRITATGTAAPPPSIDAPVEAVAHAELRDEDRTLVAEATVVWRLEKR